MRKRPFTTFTQYPWIPCVYGIYANHLNIRHLQRVSATTEIAYICDVCAMLKLQLFTGFKVRFYLAKWQKWRFRLSGVSNVQFDKFDGSSWRIFTWFVLDDSTFVLLCVVFRIKIDFDETWRHCGITWRNHFRLSEMVTVGMAGYLEKFLSDFHPIWQTGCLVLSPWNELES